MMNPPMLYWLLMCVAVQGVLFAMADCCKAPIDIVRLWMHEAYRVYRDKMVDTTDLETFDKIMKDCVKKTFEVSFVFHAYSEMCAMTI